MAKRALRLACICLVLVTATTLAGCVGDVGSTDAATAEPTDGTATTTQERTETATNGSADEADGDEVVATFRERMSDLDSYVATRRTNTSVDGNATVSEVRLWVSVETDRLRQEVVAPESRAGTVTLLNESAMAVYDPDAGEVTTYPQSRDALPVSSLPIQSLLERTTVEYLGTEAVDGETHYKVRFVPNESAAGNASLVGWLDTETYFPERVRASATGADGGYTSTTTFTDVRLDAEIDDTRFTLDVPEDVTWTEYSTPNVTSYESVHLLRGNTTLHVPAPDVPSGFALGRAHLSVGSTERATLQYTNGSATLFVFVRNTTGGELPSEAEAVDLDGRTVHYVGTGEGGYVRWECGGQSYVVSGSLPRATLLAVAGSVTCA